jgi:ATP-dependent Clp protease protease subunit
MIHQPSGGARGMVSDIEITYKEIQRLKEELTRVYVQHNSVGKTFEQLTKDMDRDTWMTSKQSLDYGLIDKIVERR